MRNFTACSIAALLATAAVASAQPQDRTQDQQDRATAPDPMLDALSQEPETEDELDVLSRTPDDPFHAFAEAKERMPVSVTIRALDKITARYTDIEAMIGEVATYGSLEILPRVCDKRPPEEFPETTAFLEIFDRDLARARASAAVEARDLSKKKRMTGAAEEETAVGVEEETASSTGDYAVQDIPALSLDPVAEAAPASSAAAAPVPEPGTPPEPAPTPSQPIDPDRIFAGWMFASSPALNPLEHPIYDVWVIDCKTIDVDK